MGELPLSEASRLSPSSFAVKLCSERVSHVDTWTREHGDARTCVKESLSLPAHGAVPAISCERGHRLQARSQTAYPRSC